MPLSEEEQRVIAEIERTFYAEDPTFARSVRSSALGGQPSDSALNNRPGSPSICAAPRPIAPFLVLALIGALLLTFGYSVHILLGFLGVCMLFFGLVLAATELKRRALSSTANGSPSMADRLAARVEAQRELRSRQAEQIRLAQQLRKARPEHPKNPE